MFPFSRAQRHRPVANQRQRAAAELRKVESTIPTFAILRHIR